MEYCELNKDNNLGSVYINVDAFNTIALNAAIGIEGIYPARQQSTMVDVKYKDGVLDVVLNVKVLITVNVSKTCKLLQKEVYTKILEMTGVKANSVGVNVVGMMIE